MSQTIGTDFLNKIDQLGIQEEPFKTLSIFLTLLGKTTLEDLQKFIKLHNDNPGLIEQIKTIISAKTRPKTVAQNGLLVLDSLLSFDRLVAGNDEHFEVDRFLGKNCLCCKNELAFRLKSIDRENKEIIITARQTKRNCLELIGFKRHIPRSNLGKF